MDIVACTDNRFVMQTGVMMYSVCANNADSDISFHLVCDESVRSVQKKDLEDVVRPFSNKSIHFYDINGNDFNDMPAMDHAVSTITKATYYRLMLTEILPKSIDKILYLDGDIIVRQSLDSLWNTDIEGYAVAAVPDYDDETHRKEGYLHLEPWTGYFNAGVLLVNLKFWRDHRVMDSFYRFMKEHRDWIRAHDQDVLNYVFNDKKKFLPIKYNLGGGWLLVRMGYDPKMYADQLDSARRDPVIVHYTTSKPWYVHHRHPHPFASTFFKYRNQTKWKDEPLWENRPLMMRFTKLFAPTLRSWGLLPELPPTGGEYIDIAPID